MQPVMTIAELTAFLDREFPQVRQNGDVLSYEAIAPGEAVVRLDVAQAHLRPGGTVSGPTLFMLADMTAWISVLAHIGPQAMTVTTNVSINFLRKPPPSPLLARGRILKLGKRLAVVDVVIAPSEEDDPVAQATATYSIPPPGERKVF
jgi:uncharacterized protein (TIGR00369 family)